MKEQEFACSPGYHGVRRRAEGNVDGAADAKEEARKDDCKSNLARKA